MRYKEEDEVDMAVSNADSLWPTMIAISTALAALGSVGTGVIIFWQARLLRIQNQINALLQLNLEHMWRNYLVIENRERKRTGRKSLEEQIRQTREKFLTDEQTRYANRISENTD
jgi:hypothetical protein